MDTFSSAILEKHMKVIAYDEPHPYIDGANCRITITADDAIKFMRKVDRRYNEQPDEEVLMDFMVIHWAHFEEIKGDRV